MAELARASAPSSCSTVSAPATTTPRPLQDAQRAIRLVRSRATEWSVDPKRIGILGFSAGGHLASTAATHFDDGKADAADPIEREGSRPDFAVLCYAGHLARRPRGPRRLAAQPARRPARPGARRAAEQRAPGHGRGRRRRSSGTPPTTPAVPVENSLLFFEALRKAGVPGELHVFPHGRHGLGLAPGRPGGLAVAAAVRRLDGGPGPPEEVALSSRGVRPPARRRDGIRVARGRWRTVLPMRPAPSSCSLRSSSAALPSRRLAAATSGSGLPISDAVLQRQWTGAWIACPGAPERDPGVFRFRKSLDLGCRSAPLRRPRERRPALRPARERPSRRHRPLARRHPLLALRDVRPRALPEAGAEPRLGHRLELRDAGARGADHRPHRLRRAGRRRCGAGPRTPTPPGSARRNRATSRGPRA